MLVVKNSLVNAGDLRAMVWSLGGEDALEKRTATHSSILFWTIPWTVEPDGLQFLGLQRVHIGSVYILTCSVAQSCPILCDPVNCSTPALSITNSQWCHPTISSSVIPFSSCPQSFPGSGSFPKSQLFLSGGQSIGASASASASVLPMNTQDWSPLGWTGWISLQSKGLSRVFSNTTVYLGKILNQF